MEQLTVTVRHVRFCALILYFVQNKIFSLFMKNINDCEPITQFVS